MKTISKHLLTLTLFLVSFCTISKAQGIYLETEGFESKGGWVVDQQFMDLMGSPYIMAHGMGEKVEDATTTINIKKSGKYHIYVRTYNWTSPWSKAEGAGKFQLAVAGEKLPQILGAQGDEWMWQYAGQKEIKKGETKLSLVDLSGFNGRCDAIYLTTKKDDVPPSDIAQLDKFRRAIMGFDSKPTNKGEYDLVVVGGGVAGISAAVSAARLGLKVALINDRPVLGGNNSSEIRVHLGGRIEVGEYKELGGLQKEFGHTTFGNARPASYYEDHKKEAIVAGEENITLFPNYRVYAITKDGKKIASVIARNIETNEDIELSAPIFSDCTGDGTVGYLAGADFHMGRESKAQFGESLAPDVADKLTMGSSVQWYSDRHDSPSTFPDFSHGVEFNKDNFQHVRMGEWTWETGMNRDQITDFERVRDYGMLVIYSNWSFLKNRYSKKSEFANDKLGWVAYIAGKRESRRLLGDYILKEDDLTKRVFHEDATGATTWTIDLHYPDPNNSKKFPGNEFLSIADHRTIHIYPIPYRCLYSRNVDNLFMAGRNISVTHVALGTVRVMRTTGIMGEVVGMAAKVCNQKNAMPRDVYRYYFDSLKELMKEGVAKPGLPNNQKFNEGTTLGE